MEHLERLGSGIRHYVFNEKVTARDSALPETISSEGTESTKGISEITKPPRWAEAILKIPVVLFCAGACLAWFPIVVLGVAIVRNTADSPILQGIGKILAFPLVAVCRITQREIPIYDKIKESKEKERLLSFQAVRNAGQEFKWRKRERLYTYESLQEEGVVAKKSFLDRAPINEILNLKITEGNWREYKHTAVERHFLRKAHKDGVSRNDQERIKDFFLRYKAHPGQLKALQAQFSDIHMLQNITQEDIDAIFSEKLENSSKAQEEYDKLQGICKEIDEHLEHPDGDHQENNKKLLRLLREAFDTPAYANLKESEDVPCVAYLHTLALGLYAEPKLLEAFDVIGTALDKEVKKSSIESDLGGDFVTTPREEGGKEGLIINDATIWYYANFISIAIGSLTSVLHIPGLPYDPRKIENTPGALYDETVVTQKGNVTVRSIYSATPTIGRYNAPSEVRGLLQALENRQFMSDEEFENDPYQYGLWNYTNLQNISKGMEATRSKAIIELQNDFPFSFHTTTVTQDSDFFVDGIRHGGNMKSMLDQMKAIQRPALDDTYKDEMKLQLLDARNFTIEHREEDDDPGYYFPIRDKEPLTTKDRQEWGMAFDAIVDEAYKITLERKKPEGMNEDEWNWMQRAAFREIVNLSVVKYSQARSINELKGAFSERDIKILVTEACKECIDRGGKFTAEMLWILGTDDTNLIKDVAAAVHSRALLSRRRLILEPRLIPFVALLVVFGGEQEEGTEKKGREIVRECLDKSSELVGVSTRGASTVR